MLTLLIFLAVLSVLVLIHEFGHFIAARICGVKAEEFGYGFPPRAIGFVKHNGKWQRVPRHDRSTYKNTIWSLNWLPLGGFVRLKGEEGGNVADKDSFVSQTLLRRFFILVAGVAMNWLLAAAIFIAGFSIGIPAQTDALPAGAIVRDQKVQIMEVVADSAAGTAGIKPGDFLLSINGIIIKTAAQAQSSLSEQSHVSEPMQIILERDQHQFRLTTKAAYLEALERPGLGVKLADTGIVRFPFWRAVGQGVTTAAMYTKLIFVGFGQLIGDLFTERKLIGGVAGPVGIAVLTGEMCQSWWSCMRFSAFLSLNLAIINFLPIPALDGGRALFIFIESLRRRRINPLFEAAVHRVGFVALLTLIFFVTVHDLQQFGGVIWRGIRGAVGL
ncbi:MAG: M50 family metallopeptidase [Candidatus Uhrbacteria bacterium]|nr:M50 family metallopeptidase [Candidatus Uhrbacteria bacterium]